MKVTYAIAITTFLFCSQVQSKEVIWNVESKFGVSRENAKPGTDMALNAVAEHFKTNPGDQIVLKYNSGTYLFLGTDPSIDLPGDFDPGANGRLIFEGEGMRNTTFITSDGSTPDINGQNVHRLTFRGIHFARNYLTVTQGTVVSVNAETEEVILELHSGFPTPEEIWSVPGKRLSQGKYLRKYTDGKSDPKVILENNRQVHYDPDKSYQIDGTKWAFKIDGGWSVARDKYKPGDIIGVKCKHGGNTYQFNGGSDIAFEDCLWTHRSRGVFQNGCTNIRFSRCRIERLSAINGRVPCLATPGGGPQIGQPNDPRIGDVVIEDCNFNSCGDDNIALFNVDGAIIRNTYSYNSFAANIKLYRCADIVIENTEVENGYFIIREDYDGDEYFLYGLQNTIVNSSGLNVIEDAQNKSRPNILIAISDDQSYIHAGPYGNAPVRTPTLNQLAREGVLFTNAFSASPMCSVSRASLLTGRYPWQNGEAGQHSSHFPAELITFTDVLENAGYTIGVSEKGWRPGNWEVTGWKRNPAGPSFTDIRTTSKPSSEISGIDYAANFKSFLINRNKNQPFCFWYGCEEPHSPFEKGSGIRAGYKINDLTLTPNFTDTSDALKSHMLDFFLEIEWFDMQLGKMIEILKETGEYDNTIIVVTSDNGSPMPGAKSSLYDYGTHVPLVILWPGKTEKGLITHKLVSQIDFAPTFLEAAGIKPPEVMTGLSFFKFLSGEYIQDSYYNREYVLAAQEKGGHERRDHLGYPIRSIRTHEYLYIRNFKPERWPKGDTISEAQIENDPWALKRPAEELYKVTEDPACLKNLAEVRQYFKIKNHLKTMLEKDLQDQNDPRMLGYGDIFESFPRYASFKPEIEGFKRRGEYNPAYLMEIPDEIFVSELYHRALETKKISMIKK